MSLPARDVLPFQNLSPHPEIQEERATALWKIATGRASIVIAPVTATTILLRSADYYADLARVLRRGESFDLERLLQHLNTVGYSATDVVEMPGQYAVRGGILMCILRKPIVRCGWSSLGMKSSRCASSIRRVSGRRIRWMKLCFCR